MKTNYNLIYSNRKNLNFKLLLTGVIFLLMIIASCTKEDTEDTTDTVTYSLDDMVGTWQRHSLITGVSNQGFWIRGTSTYGNVSSTHLVLQDNSTWDTTYTENGNFSLSSEGVITSTSDNTAHSYLSSDKNLMIGTTVRFGLSTLVIEQKEKSGTTYNSSDLQGTWKTHTLIGGGSWTGWIHATSTVGSNGSYTADNIVKSDGNASATTGTFSISSNGIITMSQVPTYHGFMSADKGLMVSNMTDGGGGGALTIAQKVVPGTTYSIADMQGKWQLHDILIGSENWTEHGLVTIDANGSGIISNMVKDNGGTFNNPGTLTFSITSDGIATNGTDFHGYVSADKKLIIGTRGDDGGLAYSLMVLQKMP